MIRNRLAHCALYFPDEELDNIEIWDEAEGEDNLQFYSPIKYKRLEIAASVIAYVHEITPPLISLQDEVELRLKDSDPLTYSALGSELPHSD